MTCLVWNVKPYLLTPHRDTGAFGGIKPPGTGGKRHRNTILTNIEKQKKSLRHRAAHRRTQDFTMDGLHVVGTGPEGMWDGIS